MVSAFKLYGKSNNVLRTYRVDVIFISITTKYCNGKDKGNHSNPDGLEY